MITGVCARSAHVQNTVNPKFPPILVIILEEMVVQICVTRTPRTINMKLIQNSFL